MVDVAALFRSEAKENAGFPTSFGGRKQYGVVPLWAKRGQGKVVASTTSAYVEGAVVETTTGSEERVIAIGWLAAAKSPLRNMTGIAMLSKNTPSAKARAIVKRRAKPRGDIAANLGRRQSPVSGERSPSAPPLDSM